MDAKINYNQTPIQEITGHPILEQAGISLAVKREDLNHREGVRKQMVEIEIQSAGSLSRVA